MPSLFFGGGMSKQGQWVIAIIVLLVIIAIAYHYYMPKSCKADTDCPSGQKCGSDSKCHKPGAGAAGAACTKATDCASVACASGKCGFRSGRRDRFNSDEMNWPTADSLVPGDVYPYGNYSGYDVLNTSMSYDPLY